MTKTSSRHIHLKIAILVLWPCFFKAQNNLSADTVFYAPGMADTVYFKNKGQLYKISTFYHDGYNTLSSESHYSQSKPDGAVILYYPNSNKILEEHYSKGLMNGVQRYYYESSDMAREINYNNGQKQGSFTNYYQNGNIKYTCTYKNNKLFGEVLCYDESGHLLNGPFAMNSFKKTTGIEGSAVNGKPDGVLKIYEDDGSYTAYTFKNGKANGSAKRYSKDNTLLAAELYKNGVFVK